MRVFADANILFSAASKQSATRELFEILHKKCEIVTCPHALEEARRNLERKRPEHADGLGSIMTKLIVSNAFCSSLSVELPQEDIPILAGAIGSQCTHLWTSDKRHFGKWYGRAVAGVEIVSSIMLANELLRSRE